MGATGKQTVGVAARQWHRAVVGSGDRFPSSLRPPPSTSTVTAPTVCHSHHVPILVSVCCSAYRNLAPLPHYDPHRPLPYSPRHPPPLPRPPLSQPPLSVVPSTRPDVCLLLRLPRPCPMSSAVASVYCSAYRGLPCSVC